MKMRLCGWAGCCKLTENYYCPEHKARADAHRKATAFQTATRYADYQNPEWKKKSAEYLKKVGACEKCGEKNNLQVHHIIPVRYAPSLFLDPSNFQVLCRNCHQIETQKEIQDRKRHKKVNR